MSNQVIYVERSGYNGYGDDHESEGGHVLATCLVIGFVVFLILML